MDVEDLEPMDILSYMTEELQTGFHHCKTNIQRTIIIDEYLRRWEKDASLDGLKNVKIEFDKDLDWFNIAEPISMHGLRGKLVILDFFTYCCINCMHVLPSLHELETEFPVEKGLAIIGVHSPKFENEKQTENIVSASQRYGIMHPIVNDNHSILWRSIGIRCWPTLVVISPTGYPMLILMGEGHSTFLKFFIKQSIEYFSTIKKDIKTFSLPLTQGTYVGPASKIRFPAKITRSDDEKYALADAGNNRILIFNRRGKVLHKVGGNSPGFSDGNFENARFNSPQGATFLNDDVLIVADTQNHALRCIRLSEKEVKTLVGSGAQGTDRVGGKEGQSQVISSPWDVAVYRTRDMDMSFHLDEQNVIEKTIILASMAGTHQIWGYFPEGIIWWKFRKFEPRTCVSLIGNGLEENRNNSYPQNAAFAQPSGLAMANEFLFIADSESSSIRKVSMLDGKVMPVVGGDRNPLNLFAFGDVDGKQFNAKLQHPLGVAYNHKDEKIYVTDSYNHKIKVIESNTNTIETVSIKDESGALYKFNEPAGLCFDSSCQVLFISDTNNHEIVIVDMCTLVATKFILNFIDVTPLHETDFGRAPNEIQLTQNLPLKNCRELRLQVNVSLNEIFKYTTDSPQKWKLHHSNSNLHTLITTGHLIDGTFTLNLHRSEVVEPLLHETLKLDLTLYVCDDRSCIPKRFSLVLNDDSTGETSELVEKTINIHISPNRIQLV